MNRRLLTTNEVAARFGLRAQTLRGWRANGTGPPYVKLGDDDGATVRYDEDAVEAWLAARTKEPIR